MESVLRPYLEGSAYVRRSSELREQNPRPAPVLEEGWLGTNELELHTARLEEVRALVLELTTGRVDAELQRHGCGDWMRYQLSLSPSLRFLWVFGRGGRRGGGVLEVDSIRAVWEEQRPALLVAAPLLLADLTHSVVGVPGVSWTIRRCSS